MRAESANFIRQLKESDLHALIREVIRELQAHPTSEAKKRGLQLMANMPADQWTPDKHLPNELWEAVMSVEPNE